GGVGGGGDAGGGGAPDPPRRDREKDADDDQRDRERLRARREAEEHERDGRKRAEECEEHPDRCRPHELLAPLLPEERGGALERSERAEPFERDDGDDEERR